MLFTDVDGFRAGVDGVLNGAEVFGGPWMGFRESAGGLVAAEDGVLADAEGFWRMQRLFRRWKMGFRRGEMGLEGWQRCFGLQ